MGNGSARAGPGKAYANRPRAAAAGRSPLLVRETRPLTVLSVDDSSLNQELVRRALEGIGRPVRCLRAMSGEECLALLQRDPGVDLVLMDFHMGGMDGAAATQAIRDSPSTASIPVVGLTAGGPGDVMIEAGAVAVLAKPATREALASAIDGALGAGARAPGAPGPAPGRPRRDAKARRVAV